MSAKNSETTEMAGGSADKLLHRFQTSVEQIRSILSCRICIKPIYEPYVLSCGHTYCYSCLSTWFSKERRNKTCPDCREEIKQLPAPAYLLKEIVQLLTKSPELLLAGETTTEHQTNQAEEAGIVEKDKRASGTMSPSGLFGGTFHKFNNLPVQQAIRDDEDGVWRCPTCAYELEDGYCNNCGHAYDSEGIMVDDFSDDLSDDGETLSMVDSMSGRSSVETARLDEALAPDLRESGLPPSFITGHAGHSNPYDEYGEYNQPPRNSLRDAMNPRATRHAFQRRAPPRVSVSDEDSDSGSSEMSDEGGSEMADFIVSEDSASVSDHNDGLDVGLDDGLDREDSDPDSDSIVASESMASAETYQTAQGADSNSHPREDIDLSDTHTEDDRPDSMWDMNDADDHYAFDENHTGYVSDPSVDGYNIAGIGAHVPEEEEVSDRSDNSSGSDISSESGANNTSNSITVGPSTIVDVQPARVQKKRGRAVIDDDSEDEDAVETSRVSQRRRLSLEPGHLTLPSRSSAHVSTPRARLHGPLHRRGNGTQTTPITVDSPDQDEAPEELSSQPASSSRRRRLVVPSRSCQQPAELNSMDSTLRSHRLTHVIRDSHDAIEAEEEQAHYETFSDQNAGEPRREHRNHVVSARAGRNALGRTSVRLKLSSICSCGLPQERHAA